MRDPQFSIHNYHLESVSQFSKRDPQLRALQHQVYQYIHPLIKQLPMDVPGIYTVTGGRQVGKTTLSKQWMAYLLKQGVAPASIAYFTGELIVDHFSLIRQLQSYIESMPAQCFSYLIIDEVTYIRDWDIGIKFLADAGLLEHVILVLTGSDLVIIQEARMRFPGRRGKAKQVDFHVHPLSFYEYVQLTQPIDGLEQSFIDNKLCLALTHSLEACFSRYLMHGGYLTAINDYAAEGALSTATLATYADWIRGDVIKHGKSEHHCREFFTAMLKRLNSQVTWTALAKDFSIEHHQTIAEYAALLMSMDAIYIQHALIEEKLTGSVKKARKLIFTDPFIYHAIYAWLNPCKDPFTEQIVPSTQQPVLASYLVESCVTSQYRRHYPTYYIKAEGEVDVAYIDEKRFWPVEVKWTQQFRPKDLKQIQKYPNGIILGKQQQIHEFNQVASYPLPWYLAKLGYQKT